MDGVLGLDTYPAVDVYESRTALYSLHGTYLLRHSGRDARVAQRPESQSLFAVHPFPSAPHGPMHKDGRAGNRGGGGSQSDIIRQ